MLVSLVAVGFVAERHLATLTTLRADGSAHVVPVGFTYDVAAGVARVIASGTTQKARNAGIDGARAVICQVDGARWVSLEGPVRVLRDAASVQDAERRYTQRYRAPRVNPDRVVIEIAVDRVLCSRSLVGGSNVTAVRRGSGA